MSLCSQAVLIASVLLLNATVNAEAFNEQGGLQNIEEVPDTGSGDIGNPPEPVDPDGNPDDLSGTIINQPEPVDIASGNGTAGGSGSKKDGGFKSNLGWMVGHLETICSCDQKIRNHIFEAKGDEFFGFMQELKLFEDCIDPREKHGNKDGDEEDENGDETDKEGNPEDEDETGEPDNEAIDTDNQILGSESVAFRRKRNARNNSRKEEKKREKEAKKKKKAEEKAAREEKKRKKQNKNNPGAAPGNMKDAETIIDEEDQRSTESTWNEGDSGSPMKISHSQSGSHEHGKKKCFTDHGGPHERLHKVCNIINKLRVEAGHMMMLMASHDDPSKCFQNSPLLTQKIDEECGIDIKKHADWKGSKKVE